MKRYRAGVIGCGRIGFGFDKDPKRKYISTHAGAYRHSGQTQLAAVCDINAKNLKECMRKWDVRSGYADLEKMLKAEKLDILSICTPPDTHYPVLKKAAQFPLKAIFCEKPLADSAGRAEKMVRICREKRIILQVGHQRRFDPLHIRLKDLIAAKRAGSVQQVNFYYTAGIKNTGSHMFDLLGFFFGDAEWIEAFYSKNSSGNSADPNLDGVIRFKNGIFAAFQACDAGKYLVFELACFLDTAKFILKNSGFSLDFYRAADSGYFSGYKELRAARPPFEADYKRNFMVNAVRHLSGCIKKGKESISSGKDGLAALRLIEAALHSANNDGKRVFLNRSRKIR